MSPQNNHGSLKYYLALATPVVVWGIAPAFIRSFSQTVGAWDSIFVRLVSVAFMSLPFLFFCGAYIARSDWPRMLLVSWVGMFGYFLGSIFGFEYIPAGVGSIIIAIQPLIIALLASALGTDRLTPAALIGLIVSLVGVVYLFGGDTSLSIFDKNTVFGAGMLMLCNVAFAINIIFSRKLVQTYGPMRVTIMTMILAAIPALAFFQPSVGAKVLNFGMMEWWALFFLGFVGTILVVILWNYAVGQLRPVTVGASLYAIPVLGVLSGWLVLGEAVTIHTLFAGIVILAGVAIAEFGKEFKIGN
jgi:drug/metabolite transporter (DMT)-like permease